MNLGRFAVESLTLNAAQFQHGGKQLAGKRCPILLPDEGDRCSRRLLHVRRREQTRPLSFL
jgi:hypothetical protein